ncbi:MAG: hypothetical protein ACYC91_06235 [Solirubrobacteraceae bacterium]
MGTAGTTSPAGETPKLSRGQQRDAAARAALAPLRHGERPAAVLISAAIALALGVVNLVFLVGNIRPSLGGQRSSPGSEIIYVVLMVACAIGLWRVRYWAVLGFMVILLITILEVSLAVIRASNLLGFLIPSVVLIGGGWLFYKLIRSLSRIQMPKYTPR